MIKVTINDRTVFLSEPVTVLEAAKRAGIKIPTLCFLEGLTPWGGCRLCLVEIERVPRLQTACTTMITDGMVVRTETEEVRKARQAVLEFLLINHPLECPVCDKAGECELQDAVIKYGPSTGRFREGKRKTPEITVDPLIVRNMKRCILCTMCVRTCEELQGAEALSVINRGDRSVVEPFSGGRFDCEYCGNCLSACPVGSLISKLHLHEYRPWMVESEEGICGFCGVGCRILIQRRGNNIIRFWSNLSPIGGGSNSSVTSPFKESKLVAEVTVEEPNNGLTCATGRFGYDFLEHELRLRSPFLRVGDARYTISKEECFKKTAQSLLEIKNKYGPFSIAGIAGGRLTNEDAYLFGKLIRGLGSNNLDSTARLGYVQSQQFFEELFGPGATANRAQGVLSSEAIIVAGGDPMELAPVFGTYIRQASKKGGLVLTIGAIPGLQRHRRWAIGESGDEQKALRGLTRAIIEQKGGASNSWSKTLSPPKGKEGLFKKLFECLEPLIKQEEVDQEIKDIAETLSKKELICLVLSGEALQKKGGLIDLFCLGLIAYLLDARVYLLQEFPNDQGLIDLGIGPDILPGGRDLTLEAWRSHVEEIWGFPIPSENGKDLYSIIELIEKGEIKALYVAGLDPVTEIPGGGRIREALKKLELLIVQDSFFTETMNIAHIGIPVASWPERDGSYTNFERRIQFFHSNLLEKVTPPSIPPLTLRGGKGELAENNMPLPDWEVFNAIGRNAGLDMPYRSINDIWLEICSVSGLHKALSPSVLKKGLLWPYLGEPLRHTIPVTEEWLKGLKGGVMEKGGVKIIVEKFPYLSATISRYSKALNLIGGSSVSMAPGTVEALKRRFGGFTGEVPVPSGEVTVEVTISGPYGGINLPLRIDHRIPEDIIKIPFYIEGKGIYEITDFSRDITGAPVWSLDITEVRKTEVRGQKSEVRG
jgi:predicted molibdopterin-dependent oxidoreductase YjgC